MPAFLGLVTNGHIEMLSEQSLEPNVYVYNITYISRSVF